MMLKSFFSFSVTALLLSACGTAKDAPMLEGQIDASEPTKLTYLYDIDGDVYSIDALTDSTGRFVFNEDMPTNSADISIYIGQDVYGAFVEKGKSTRMHIAEGKASFDGDNTDRSDFINAYEQAYSVWKFKPTPDKPFDFDVYTSRLSSGYDNATAKLAAIDSDDVRETYARRNEARYTYYVMSNLKMRQMIDHIDAQAEIDSIIAAIDPNDDATRFSGLLPYWMQSSGLMQSVNTNSINEYYPALFAAIDKALTNEGNKKSLYNNLGQYYFMFQPSDSDAAEFMAKVEPYLVNAPSIKAGFQEIIDRQSKIVKDGDGLPCNPELLTPEGTKTSLLDELKGKIVYIDFWATWCGPCCAEIPHLERVVEKFKGNDDVRFLSISIDEDTNAWLSKLKRDNPQWPQYILPAATGEEFIEAMSLHSIPRFVIIGRDGKFISSDAIRPSSDKIEDTLMALTKN